MSVDDFVRALPGAALRGAVAWYSGYRQVDVAPARHRGLPSPYLTLIFTLDDPLVVAQQVDRRRAPSRYAALLGGLHTAPAVVAHDGRQSGIQVAINPLASRALFGLPAGELAGIDGHAADVIGASRVDEIRSRLLDGRHWPGRLAALETHLCGLAEPDRRVPAEVRYAWRRLRRTGGRIGIRELAQETGWSARHLQAKFRIETGLTPKQAARVIRFDRARHALAPAPHAGIAAVAADHGYTDQSHLDREFRALAGCSPTTWLREEFRNIQGGHWTPPAD
ncbi:helix-turn-helix domain-containing protein [Amycolatopsis sp. SID8362]|uniref:AraC family transcriptional regulator n=1 Tax=Amycolatopsis sp. SID8362 TaxID=2690346 RepID=UPI001944B445|nr:helix-turn-helix domain-containing protein [Amycolatopsis sp. SID8362]